MPLYIIPCHIDIIFIEKTVNCELILNYFIRENKTVLNILTKKIAYVGTKKFRSSFFP